MKPVATLSLLAVSALAFLQLGCNQRGRVDATQPLKESFQSAEPEVKEAIETVTSNLKAGNYAEVARTLAPIATGRPLTAPQKEAMGIALLQVNQAIAADPALDTREMYELREKMFLALRQGPRF